AAEKAAPPDEIGHKKSHTDADEAAQQPPAKHTAKNIPNRAAAGQEDPLTDDASEQTRHESQKTLREPRNVAPVFVLIEFLTDDQRQRQTQCNKRGPQSNGEREPPAAALRVFLARLQAANPLLGCLKNLRTDIREHLVEALFAAGNLVQ